MGPVPKSCPPIGLVASPPSRGLWRVFAQSVAVAMTFVVAAGSARAAVSIEEFVKQKSKWSRQVGQRQVIEGRYAVTGRTLLTFQNCTMEFRSTEPLPKLTRRSPRDVNVQVAGRLRRDGAKLFFHIERVTKLEDDLTTYQRRRPTGPKAKPADWFALSDWASGRGAFYKDKELLSRATEANKRGVQLARRKAAGDETRLREVARTAVVRGLPATIRQAIEHEALRADIEAARGKRPLLASVKKRIQADWAGAGEVARARDSELESRYRNAPVSTYDAAPEAERRRLHRLIYVEVALALILESARANGSNGEQVAAVIRREVPEAVAVAEKYEKMALDRDLASAARLSRQDLGRLVSRLKMANRGADGNRAVDAWLASRRDKLLDDGVAGRLRLADLLLSLKNDRQGAVALLIEADRLEPGVKELAERLGQLGYEKKNGSWVPLAGHAVSTGPQGSVPTGVRVGMTGKALLAAMGTPRRVSRLAARGRVSEIWVYGDPGGSRIAVHLLRSPDDGRATVRRISQLQARR